MDRIFFATAVTMLLSSTVQAQTETSNQQTLKSVYDASTQAAEKPFIKSLNAEEFSAYAADICKKYDLGGPLHIECPKGQAELYQKLTDTRKLLFSKLCDPEVRKDETLKTKFQAQIKSLTQDIRTFPSLNGLEVVPLAKDSHLSGKMVKNKTPAPSSIAPASCLTNLADPIDAVRKQIKQKHGKYYVPLEPKK